MWVNLSREWMDEEKYSIDFDSVAERNEIRNEMDIKLSMNREGSEWRKWIDKREPEARNENGMNQNSTAKISGKKKK